MNRFKILFLIFAILVIIGQIMVCIVIHTKEKNSNDDRVDNLMREITNDIFDHIQNTIDIIKYAIDRDEIIILNYGKNLTQAIYTNSTSFNTFPFSDSVQTFMWFPMILDHEKEEYNKFVRNNIQDPFEIFQFTNDLSGPRIPVSNRTSYFPMMIGERQTFLGEVLNNRGLDFITFERGRTVLTHANSTRNFTVSVRADTISLGKYNYGFGLWKPVYDEEKFAGFYNAIVNMIELVEPGIPSALIARSEIDFLIFHMDEEQEARNETLMYKENKPEYSGIWKAGDFETTMNTYYDSVSILDRNYAFYLIFSEDYINEQKSSTYITIPIILAIIFIIVDLAILLGIKFYLQNSKLESQKKEMNVAKYMLGYVNHEIRNPLNGIQGMISIGMETIDDMAKIISNDEMNESEKIRIINENMRALKSDLATSRRSCDLLSHIVNDVLDIRKLEEKKVILDYKYVKLSDLMLDLSRILTPKINEKAEVELQIPLDTEYQLKTDEFRLKQLLLNILTNAIKFTDKGSIVLEIKNEPNKMAFYVKDTGRGISQTVQEHIFKPFNQVKTIDGTRYGGVGLGLYLCHMLVENMDGEIGFTSVENKGSTFWIKLPCKHIDV